MQQIEFRAMGSRVRAWLESEQPAPILDEVAGWFETWEQALSRFRMDSELTRVNAAAGAPRRVSETLWQVLLTAVEAQALSGGLVNPLILEDVLHAGYDRGFEQLADHSDSESPSALPVFAPQHAILDALPSVQSIIIDAQARTLCVPPGTGLDFGGVGKGWAAHQAAHRLGHTSPALVSAGGDVAVSGPLLSGEPWQIGVEDPLGGSDFIEMLYLEAPGGVATSGKDHRHWQRGGLFQHHIIDPRTHEPAITDILAVTVVAATVMRAEALAKAVMISGSEAGLAMLDAFEGAEGILVLEDGRRRFSRGIEKYL